MRSFAIIALGESGRGEFGRGKSEHVAAALHARLQASDVLSKLYMTSPEKSLPALVERALQENASRANELCMVFCGGDGTIQAGIQCLKSVPTADVLVGLAPAGTCNDFAYALGIKHKLDDIVDVLLHGVERTIDLGKAADKYFCTIATLGFESVVNRHLRERRNYSPSRWSFTLAAIRLLATHAPLQVTLTANGQKQELRVLSLIFANTACYGGHIPIAPSADPGDGQLELVIVHKMPAWRRLLLFPLAILGKHIGRVGVTCEATDLIKIETDQRYEIWADGEPIGETPLTISVVPKALRVLIPKH